MLVLIHWSEVYQIDGFIQRSKKEYAYYFRNLNNNNNMDGRTRLSKISCQWRSDHLRLRQTTVPQDTDKSQCVAITEFNNCLIIRSPILFSYLNHALTAQGSDHNFSHKNVVTRPYNYYWAEYYLQQAVLHIGRPFFVGGHLQRTWSSGHVVSPRPMKRKKELYRIKMQIR